MLLCVSRSRECTKSLVRARACPGGHARECTRLVGHLQARVCLLSLLPLLPLDVIEVAVVVASIAAAVAARPLQHEAEYGLGNCIAKSHTRSDEGEAMNRDTHTHTHT